MSLLREALPGEQCPGQQEDTLGARGPVDWAQSPLKRERLQATITCPEGCVTSVSLTAQA